MDCIFCAIAEKKVPAKIISDEQDILAFHDNNPQAPVHILIIPKQHIATINDLTKENSSIIANMYLAAKQIASDLQVSHRGYRLVMNCNREAGQSVFHIHLHLLAGRRMAWPPG